MTPPPLPPPSQPQRSPSPPSFPLTLWDLLEPVIGRLRPAPKPTPPPAAKPRSRKPASAARTPTAQQRYDAVTRAMLAQYAVRVRKWRTSMSGVAWCVAYTDGTITRLIESPRPRGPMSAAVFLHEIGHHAIGFNTYKPRCLEEYHAWRWSLEQMEAHGLNITDAVRRRMHLSLWYAVDKARRRGLREIPPELQPFTSRPPPRRQHRSGS